ncbi:prolyl oligopeptidase family serine peptidase [Seonamhaeicola algicola]|uniref:Prolyl oligopeptidase family serine peptidase n=3 Tax=Seonamhaeicola TaxID=1649495 RepID=A0A5C7AIH1_9FLAO|nr:DPP IV N-terminal domain-containing protein [Seonamhaeicola algicola]TXE07283.1 prolyl oligopeptidase family serine peptidase [Seonamhaeicola algicola]
MNKFIFSFFLLFVSFIINSQEANENNFPEANYRLASKFSPSNISKKVHSTEVYPQWLASGNKFWYQYKTTEGANYYLVDCDRKTKVKLFDNAKMAKWLSEITKDAYDSKHLPRFNFEFVKDETAIRFRVTSREMVIVKSEEDKAKTTNDSTSNKDSISIKKIKRLKPKKERKSYYLEYKLGSDNLIVIDNSKKKDTFNKWANVSPDSSLVVFTKKHNLYWMDKTNFLKALKNDKDTTIVEHEWTKDGVENFSYSRSNMGISEDEIEKKIDDRKPVYGYWTHDSKKFIFQRSDVRHIKDLWVINSVTKGRPTLERYKYHMAGEQEFPKNYIEIFDVSTKKKVNVLLDTTIQQSLSIYRYSYKKSDTTKHKPTLILSKKGNLYFNTVSRDRKRLDIHVANVETGEVKTIINEHSNVYVEARNKPFYLFNDEKEIVHWSERDGWGHLYLYDAKGNLKRQITKGEFHVDGLHGIDENERIAYFLANGVSKDENPYYAHFYKINLNGTNLKSLNPGDFNSKINLSDSNKYFVSNYSRVNTVPKAELRTTNGSLVMDLEEADLSELFASGYKFPEPFKAKASDGITNIYGVMYKPFDFDENKKYPIIEYVYPGPQTEAVNASFSVRMDNVDRLAQVGFIVVTLGNRGGDPRRSKWYHTYGYGNLRDYGLADKKYVAEQLADRHGFIDINKVGITGHSGGGFMSTAAMLVYPDFFKVAVSSAGNHDNNIYNSWWSETHHGIDEDEQADGSIKYKYLIDTNQTLAQNLKGNILLATGDIDNNVHPGGTIRMVNAFIKANKRFDFIMFPGQRHAFGNMTEYFFWKKADYFSKHLLGNEPTNVDITEMNRDVPKKR